jgi:hypothetical protein
MVLGAQHGYFGVLMAFILGLRDVVIPEIYKVAP